MRELFIGFCLGVLFGFCFGVTFTVFLLEVLGAL